MSHLSHTTRHSRIIIFEHYFYTLVDFLIFFLYILKISKSYVKPKALPWREENDTYVLTAYFKDPSLICSKKHSHARYIGDRLLIQNSSKSSGLVQVPLLEDGLLKTMWTEGECFWSMGKLGSMLNASRLRISPGHFLLAVFYRVKHNGLSERETARCLQLTEVAMANSIYEDEDIASYLKLVA